MQGAQGVNPVSVGAGRWPGLQKLSSGKAVRNTRPGCANRLDSNSSRMSGEDGSVMFRDCEHRHVRD